MKFTPINVQQRRQTHLNLLHVGLVLDHEPVALVGLPRDPRHGVVLDLVLRLQVDLDLEEHALRLVPQVARLLLPQEVNLLLDEVAHEIAGLDVLDGAAVGEDDVVRLEAGDGGVVLELAWARPEDGVRVAGELALAEGEAVRVPLVGDEVGLDAAGVLVALVGPGAEVFEGMAGTEIVETIQTGI